MNKFIFTIVIAIFFSNCYAWDLFKKDEPQVDYDSPLTSNEFAKLKITGNPGRGNTLKIKIYNGLPASVNCSTVRFIEGKNSSYPIVIQSGVFMDDDGNPQTNSTLFWSHSIRNLQVQAFNLNKATTFNIEGCTCSRNIKTKQCQ